MVGATVQQAQSGIQVGKLCGTLLPWQPSAGSIAELCACVCVCVGPSRVEISHLTRRVTAVLPGADLVVLGDLDPLVGLHAGLAQPLAALHAEAYRPCVVLATRTHLK